MLRGLIQEQTEGRTFGREEKQRVALENGRKKESENEHCRFGNGQITMEVQEV